MIDIRRIDRLDEINRAEKRLRREWVQLTEGYCYSIESLRVVYAATRAFACDRGLSIGNIREYFLFVALYMFEPSSMVKKMRNGMRKDLADVLMVSENNISHLTRHLLFRYRHYKEFRSDVNDIYVESMKVMRT